MAEPTSPDEPERPHQKDETETITLCKTGSSADVVVVVVRVGSVTYKLFERDED